MNRGEGMKSWYLHLGPADATPNAVLVGDPARVALFESRLENVRYVASDREFHTLVGVYHGVPVSVTSTGMGAPAAAVAIEELARLGVRRIVRVGTLMGVNAPLSSLVLAQAAVRYDGLSRSYASLHFPAVPDASLYSAFRRALSAKTGDGGQSARYPWTEGIVVSTDAFYSRMIPPTPAPRGDDGFDETALARWGVAGMDMETSALYVVARSLGVAAVSLCAVTVAREGAQLIPPGPRGDVERYLVGVALEGLRAAEGPIE